MDTFLKIFRDLRLGHTGFLDQFFFQRLVVFHEFSDFSTDNFFFAPENNDVIYFVVLRGDCIKNFAETNWK